MNRPIFSPRWAVSLLGLALAGCGTFPLGTVQPQVGKTADEQQLAMLTCENQASMAVESAGR